MKTRRLADTDLEVSEICLGTMTWGEQNTEAEAHAQLDLALARGINFIDTAEMYPAPPRAETQGRTEAYLARWLARTRKRDGLVIASKVAGPGRRDWIRGGRTESSALRPSGGKRAGGGEWQIELATHGGERPHRSDRGGVRQTGDSIREPP